MLYFSACAPAILQYKRAEGGAIRTTTRSCCSPCQKGGYNVFVPAIPEICTYGETLEDARAMAQDAIRCFPESALETGESIPPDVEPAVGDPPVRFGGRGSDIARLSYPYRQSGLKTSRYQGRAA